MIPVSDRESVGIDPLGGGLLGSVEKLSLRGEYAVAGPKSVLSNTSCCWAESEGGGPDCLGRFFLTVCLVLSSSMRFPPSEGKVDAVLSEQIYRISANTGWIESHCVDIINKHYLIRVIKKSNRGMYHLSGLFHNEVQLSYWIFVE
jgi:hypothetical protein